MTYFKKIITLIFIFSYACSSVLKAQNKTLPHLAKHGKSTKLIVNDEPMLLISGEFHNSSSSTVSYLKKTWDKIKEMNMNSVIASISWEQFEPQEGVYDYTLIDQMIKRATKDNIKLVVIWFATWKNGKSTYVPMWVKKDSKRFFRMVMSEGNTDVRNIEVISPFCEEARKADAKAFAALLKRIAAVDKAGAVVMMQPENEVGLFMDMDHHPVSLKMYNSEVPATLIKYMQKNKKHLQNELLNVWEASGFKKKGSWKDVFGDTPDGKEFFTAWQFAIYINSIVKAGKAEHNIPMFVNAWVVQKPDDLPGIYPNGGPVSRVMDVYKAAAPDIDLVCPDIYLTNYKEVSGLYVRHDNPLIVPETRLMAGRAFYSFAEDDAIGFSPFGIEDGATDFEFVQAYKVLNELEPLILKYQGTGKMRGFLKEGDEKEQNITIGAYNFEIRFQGKEAYGLIIQTGEDEFQIAGKGYIATVSSAVDGMRGYIGQRWEGYYDEEDVWHATRLLNGDEGGKTSFIRVKGREHKTDEKLKKFAEVRPDMYSANKNKFIYTPGVYKVITYSVSK